MVEEENKYKRNVAYKLRVGDILLGKPIIIEERFKHLELGGKEIVRINVVANIVDKYASEGEKSYGTLTIDDASGQIRIKMFSDEVKKYENINPGNTVMIIGLLRYYNGEVYISPEVISIKEPRYLLVRKLELETEKPKSVDKEKILAVKDQIIKRVKEAEEDGGIDTEKLVMEIKASPELINQEIKRMLEEGLAYEPRPGRIRYLG
ncbi:hypothetical protein COU61_02425 [Candidatus Pacearchaeota archaeon CG10_big_fil_rev_8_21_14_0_10_35_13]|nr:MAG: hypothetical protein COU61_02425 [Candidatus Pacearchaeota archaeon CG10_big_fil_rev_8_21_14_0_10_35_13]